MSTDIPASFEERLRERERLQSNPLSTIPSVDVRIAGNLPNTPLSAATIAFSLGTVFCFGFSIFLGGLSAYWWMTYQLGFFVAAWAAFHFGEFAVTAGWNLEKCSVECKWAWVTVYGFTDIYLAFLLDNGSMYHIANGSAILEYIVTLYLMPSFKTRYWVSVVGMSGHCFL